MELIALHESAGGDSWDFTSSDCDQGLFFYMLYVRHRLGAFAMADAQATLRVHLGCI